MGAGTAAVRARLAVQYAQEEDRGKPAKRRRSKPHQRNFDEGYPETRGKVVVHHSIEQVVLKKWPGLFTKAELDSLENLRGIPKGSNSSMHLHELRHAWNRFYKRFPKGTPPPTREQVIAYRDFLDWAYGRYFWENEQAGYRENSWREQWRELNERVYGKRGQDEPQGETEEGSQQESDAATGDEGGAAEGAEQEGDGLEENDNWTGSYGEDPVNPGPPGEQGADPSQRTDRGEYPTVDGGDEITWPEADDYTQPDADYVVTPDGDIGEYPNPDAFPDKDRQDGQEGNQAGESEPMAELPGAEPGQPAAPAIPAVPAVPAAPAAPAPSRVLPQVPGQVQVPAPAPVKQVPLTGGDGGGGGKPAPGTGGSQSPGTGSGGQTRDSSRRPLPVRPGPPGKFSAFADSVSRILEILRENPELLEGAQKEVDRILDESGLIGSEEGTIVAPGSFGGAPVVGTPVSYRHGGGDDFKVDDAYLDDAERDDYTVDNAYNDWESSEDNGGDTAEGNGEDWQSTEDEGDHWENSEDDGGGEDAYQEDEDDGDDWESSEDDGDDWESSEDDGDDWEDSEDGGDDGGDDSDDGDDWESSEGDGGDWEGDGGGDDSYEGDDGGGEDGAEGDGGGEDYTNDAGNQEAAPAPQEDLGDWESHEGNIGSVPAPEEPELLDGGSVPGNAPVDPTIL